MGVQTLLLYLLGHRPSIEKIARSPDAVWIGLMLVVSAGLAREYDGEDLLREPWHVFLPLGASLLTSYLLFVLLGWSFDRRAQAGEADQSHCSRYKRFLGLYWATAPLAWLYAIPVEQFLSPGNSVRANLSLLGIVSLWRVLLITRVASILHRRSFAASFIVVMLFADTVAMVIFWLTPLPILSVMGGIRLTESEDVILGVGIVVRFLGTVTWPIWLIGGFTCALTKRPNRGEKLVESSSPLAADLARERIGQGLRSLAAISILVWLPILPFTQPQQANRRHAERLLYADRIAEAVAFMSKLERKDFPRHWAPPPRLGYLEQVPQIDLVLGETEKPAAAEWVRDLFRQKLEGQLHAYWHAGMEHALNLGEMDDERLARYAQTLENSAFGPIAAKYHESEIRALLELKAGGSRQESLEKLSCLIPADRPIVEE